MKAAKLYEVDGETHSLYEWSRISGIKVKTIRARLKSGWSVEDAIFKTVNKQHCIARSSKECFHCPYPDCIRDVPLVDL